MKANIAHGKLLPPKTLGAALKRRKQLEFEIARIEKQIVEYGNINITRPAFSDPVWPTNATRALNLFQLELRLLSEWIDVRQDDSERLLRESFEVLKVLEGAVEFKPHESALMGKLEDWFDNGKETA